MIFLTPRWGDESCRAQRVKSHKLRTHARTHAHNYYLTSNSRQHFLQLWKAINKWVLVIVLWKESDRMHKGRFRAEFQKKIL